MDVRLAIGLPLRRDGPDVRAHAVVLRRERLVEQVAERVAHQRASDRDPLPLAVVELGRLVLEHVVQGQEVRDLLDPVVDLVGSPPRRRRAANARLS